MPVVARNVGLLPYLLGLNLAIFVAMLVLASCFMHKYIDINAEQQLRSDLVMSYVLAFSIVTALSGVWSVLAGLIHLRTWSWDSLTYAIISVIATWGATIYTSDVVWRNEVNIREQGIYMRILEGLIMILLGTQPTFFFVLCYVTFMYGLA